VHSNFTIWYAPEADLLAVANHDFSQLSPPILVACRDQEQFEEFTFREGLMCSQVRRFRAEGNDTENYPHGKILLLLPGWFDDLRTHAAVECWVNLQDRFTVELRSPRPLARKRPAWGWIFALSAVGWVWFIAWLLTRR
jgi:hypothetical protein